MNQVAKTEQATSVPNSRPAAGMRNIAMINRMEVEELSPPGSVSFNDAAFMFRDFMARESLARRGDSPPRHPGSFNTPSQTFAILLESNDVAGVGGGGGSDRPTHGFAGLVSRAIGIYEANARIISGPEKALGSSLSLIL